MQDQIKAHGLLEDIKREAAGRAIDIHAGQYYVFPDLNPSSPIKEKAELCSTVSENEKPRVRTTASHVTFRSGGRIRTGDSSFLVWGKKKKTAIQSA